MVVKAPDAFRTIGEVSEALDLPTHVLRFWEGKFKSHIIPTKCNGRRLYDPKAIESIKTIKDLLYNKGMTIKGAQRFLDSSEKDPSITADEKSAIPITHEHKTLAQTPFERQDIEHLEQIYQQLQRTHQRLQSLGNLFVLADVGA